MKQLNRYKCVDQLLHKVAFSTEPLQMSFVDIEDFLYKNQFQNIDNESPVFVSSVPRSGTTILLELLSSTQAFAFHSYRNMPFLLTPIIWKKFSWRFWKYSEAVNRAHGDGILIHHDSPEAFEEVLWKSFWKGKYKGNHIDLWYSEEENEDFDKYFVNHLKKIIFLAVSDGARNVRYLSKNNGNISRIRYLKKIFPDRIMLVPFREPVVQAASIKEQHDRFLKIHKQDSFSRQYMEDIGHFEFGEHLKLFNFNGWLNRADISIKGSLNYFLEYWCEAFSFLYREHKDDVYFLDYSNLCKNPHKSLTIIAQKIGLGVSSDLVSRADVLRPNDSHEVDVDQVSTDLVERATDLYRKLIACSII